MAMQVENGQSDVDAMVDDECKKQVATYSSVWLIQGHTTGAIAPTPTPFAFVGALHMHLLPVSACCSPLLDRVEP
jgi:hypothetical protein